MRPVRRPGLWRLFDECEEAGEAGDIKDLAQVRGCATEDDQVVLTDKLPPRAHQDGKPGRVEMLEPRQIHFEFAVAG